MKKLMLAAFAAWVTGVATAGENLLPESFVNDLCQKPKTGVTYLKSEGGMPEGVLVTTDKAMDPVYRIETSAVVPGAVKKGDLIVFTAAVRGVAPGGRCAVLLKFQDNTYTGALRDNVTATSTEWTWCRVTGVAPKDYAADSMRLHVYPWTGAQQMEIRGWRLENMGQIAKAQLPPLAAAPKWPAGELKSPEPPPPPKPVELAPLTDEQRAKKRYCIFKFDDVGNHNGRVHPKFDKVAKFLAERKLHGSFGVIVKSIENQPNADYIAWLKANAIENGGNFEFWNHGWDHAMFFNCKETDDDCDRTAKFHGEYVTGLIHQRRHLNKALDVFKEKTGLEMHTLGTAGNAGDDNTRKVLAERPEVKVWIFGKGQSTPELEVLGRWLNLEHAVGKVDYVDFVKNYQRNRMKDYIVLQGHCAMWSDQHYADFTKVVDLLQKEGWIFVTPYEYYQIKHGGRQ